MAVYRGNRHCQEEDKGNVQADYAIIDYNLAVPLRLQAMTTWRVCVSYTCCIASWICFLFYTTAPSIVFVWPLSVGCFWSIVHNQLDCGPLYCSQFLCIKKTGDLILQYACLHWSVCTRSCSGKQVSKKLPRCSAGEFYDLFASGCLGTANANQLYVPADWMFDCVLDYLDLLVSCRSSSFSPPPHGGVTTVRWNRTVSRSSSTSLSLSAGYSTANAN